MTETLFGNPVNPVDVAVTNIWQNLFKPNGYGGVPDALTNPVGAFNYLHNKADMIRQAAQQRPLVRIADKNLRIVGELTGEMTMEFEELMHDSGSAKYVVRYNNHLTDYIVNLTAVEEDLHLVIDPIPTQPNWQTRWGGKLTEINIQRHDDGTNTLELNAISMREHAKRLLYAANPIFAPEVQLPKMWVLPGPIRSVLFMSNFINLARLFLPGLSSLVNAFNPEAWLSDGELDLNQLNPLDWPIQQIMVNPALDTSSWTVLGATWTDWHSSTQDLLKDAGAMMRFYTYIVDDDADTPSPYAELNQLLGIDPTSPEALRPRRNAVLVSIEDKSGRNGPTGTALDGLLSVIGVTLDDLFSSTLIDVNTGLQLNGEPVYDVNGNNIPIAESLLGVAPQVPKVIWREGQFSGLIEATHTIHKGSPKVVMTGGRSPTLVNQLQTFGIRYALAQLSSMINVGIGTFVNTAWQMPATPGLENLYQGQLDNVLFAWERITSPIQGIWGGDLDFQEYFERGSSTAYTLSTFVTLSTALWKNRAYHGFKARVRNGMPWTINVDSVLGDRNGFEFDQIIFVDQIYGIKYSVSRTKALLVEMTIGEDQNTYDPMGRVMRAVQSVYTMFGAFLGEGLIFG